MPRTATSNTNDLKMWRRLLSCVHPDRNGDHDLFIWVTHLKDNFVESPETETKHQTSTSEEKKRIDIGKILPGDVLVAARMSLINEDLSRYPEIRILLEKLQSWNSWEANPNSLNKGATYKQLAYLGHLVDMGESCRTRWYRIAESIEIREGQAGFLIASFVK